MKAVVNIAAIVGPPTYHFEGDVAPRAFRFHRCGYFRGKVPDEVAERIVKVSPFNFKLATDDRWRSAIGDSITPSQLTRFLQFAIDDDAEEASAWMTKLLKKGKLFNREVHEPIVMSALIRARQKMEAANLQKRKSPASAAAERGEENDSAPPQLLGENDNDGPAPPAPAAAEPAEPAAAPEPAAAAAEMSEEEKLHNDIREMLLEKADADDNQQWNSNGIMSVRWIEEEMNDPTITAADRDAAWPELSRKRLREFRAGKTEYGPPPAAA